MKKIVLPGFIEKVLTNRLITSQEDIHESLDLGDNKGQVCLSSSNADNCVRISQP